GLAMGNNREIGIGTLGHIFCNFYIYLIGIFRSLAHSFTFKIVYKGNKKMLLIRGAFFKELICLYNYLGPRYSQCSVTCHLPNIHSKSIEWSAALNLLPC